MHYIFIIPCRNENSCTVSSQKLYSDFFFFFFLDCNNNAYMYRLLHSAGATGRWMCNTFKNTWIKNRIAVHMYTEEWCPWHHCRPVCRNDPPICVVKVGSSSQPLQALVSIVEQMKEQEQKATGGLKHNAGRRSKDGEAVGGQGGSAHRQFISQSLREETNQLMQNIWAL